MCWSNVVITGGTGFVGTHFPSSIRRVNIREPGFERGFNNCHTVIHLAGLAHGKFSVNEYDEVNVFLTENVANKAVLAGVKRFVFLSTVNVNAEQKRTEATNSKAEAEKRLKLIAENSGLELVILRSPLVYGIGAPGNFGLLVNIIRKWPVLPFGLTNNKRDFIAVQNLVDLLMTCAKHQNAAGHTFLASDGETVSIKDFTNAIAKGLGKSIVQIPVPVNLMRLSARLIRKSVMAEQLLGDLQVDSSNSHDVLGWVPPYTMKQAMASLSEK